MTENQGFEFRERATGEVAIFRLGRMVKMMRGADAKAFLAAVAKGDAQQVMAESVGSKAATPPGTGPRGAGKALSGDGQAHGHGEFRRRSG